MYRILFGLFATFVVSASLSLAAPPLRITLEDVSFPTELAEAKAISGVASIGDFLVLVSDEVKNPTVVHLLKKNGAGYKFVGDVKLLTAGKKEVDLEAVANDGDMIYVTGSHCSTRKVDNGSIESIELKKPREQIFRFKLKADGTAGDIDGPNSLTPAIEAHPVLRDFRKLASKENGVDIEGLAFKNGRLHFGFRGPVLREGFVPVLSCTWQDPTGTAEVRYLRLDGRGIRDLVAVDDGFLVLAGPVGDGDTSYRVYFWDGADQLPARLSGPKPTLLGEFPDLGDAKPEGLTLLKTEGHTYELLLLCDGLPKGKPSRFKVTRP